jgi:hypothetical protein
MFPSWVRGVIAALIGAVAGGACMVALYAFRADVDLTMERDPPSFTTGFYPAERAGELSFAWTARRADVVLAGADRREDWACAVTFSGARPGTFPQPDMKFAVDGTTLAGARATNDFQTIQLMVPANATASGLRLTMTASETFVPSQDDRRALGVQVDRVVCRPARGWVRPPWRAVVAATVGGAAWGAAFAVAGATLAAAVAAAACMAIVQAFALTTGAAPYGVYPEMVLRFSVWIALIAIVVLLLMSRRARPPHALTRFAIACSAAMLYVKLLAIVHPSKALVDAVFHAHRLEWVLAGRYYFTQLSTSGTPFPYAIGLYVFAAPWAALTHDHVTLLRVIVCAADALAGALLYAAIVRVWGDRLVAAFALVFFAVVPVWYTVVGNANLTNAFGQSASIVAIVAAIVAGAAGLARPVQWLAVTALAALALTSHVSTLTLLLPTLLALGAVAWWRGGHAERRPAQWLIASALLAALLSVAFYWGHFGDVYAAQLARMRTAADTGPSPRAPAPLAPALAGDNPPRLGHATISLPGRIRDAFAQTESNVGWPILALSLVGAWRIWHEGRHDRLLSAVIAWAIVGIGFVALSVLSATNVKYQQDAWEFIGRVEHATYPAAVVLAACGAAWMWRGRGALRVTSAALLLSALAIGAREWWRWLN